LQKREEKATYISTESCRLFLIWKRTSPGAAVSTSDKKEYGLVTQTMHPRPRRSVSMRDYSLPKPYRKKVFVEEAPTTSKTKLALWTVSGILIAGLVVELGMLAQETMRQRELPIIAAAPPRPAVDEAPAPRAVHKKAAAAAAIAIVAPAAAALAHEPLPGLAPGRTGVMRVKLHPAAGKHGKPAGWQAPALVPEPDPDVVLITTILLLAPQLQDDSTQNACSAAAPKDNACADLHGMLP
jgi:hypothetical protein